MKINYRIGDLELRLQDLPEVANVLHSPYSEIVQWSSKKDGTEFCWTIATFEYDKGGYPELHYCGDRPLELDEDNTISFLTLIREGYNFNRNENGILIRKK